MDDRQKIKFAQIIKKIRASKKISQTELSKKTGFPQTTISDWENDKYLPDIMEAQKLAAVLGVTLSDLLDGKFSFPKHKAS
jgi:transcriptional regulator with XRE-family HTH domain